VVVQDNLLIEIFSDVVCPWCFIGKRRLDRALEGELSEAVELRWRPYQLHPTLPATGIDRGEYLLRRYGEEADRGKVPARIGEEAALEGITLHFDRIERLPNTLLAHRVLEYAYRQGSDVQHALAEALFQGYFCEGVDVGNLDALVQICEQTGVATGGLREFIDSGGGIDEVQEQLDRAPDVGISGVPGYYLASGFLLPGAQTAEVMQQIITRVKNKIAQRADQARDAI